MGDGEVKGAARNVLRADTNVGPIISLETSDLIHIAVEGPGQRGTVLVGCRIEIEALDACRQPILEPVDDREVARQIVPERLFDLLAALEWVEFPHSALCGY